MSLKDYWYIAAESRELRQKPLAVAPLGERMVLFRMGDGRVAALEDRCSHRNIALSQGTVASGCVTCPYHGWSFDAAGRCVKIPSLGSCDRLPTHGVRAYPVREQAGYIWIYPGESIPESGPFEFPHEEERNWTTFRMRTRFAATVESCLENFLDCPHTVYVHGGWFRNHDTKELSAIVRSTANSVEVEFRGEPITKSLVSQLFFPNGKELRHTDRFLMPNISRVDYDFGPDRHFIITSQCTPLSEFETDVFTVISFSFGRIAPLVRLLLEPICRKIIRQDVDILAAQTEQVRRFRGAQFSHVQTDLLGLKIHSLRRRAERSEARSSEARLPEERSEETVEPAEQAREITICF
ncbi:MAG TPA: aromatic ring-hydroxylating dioxygenase subunit alpha [Candidatus Solibacter sp.]|nr:aromatic ring-hydroxylating dioxygenase subunit alpha [Candidatus Solibacter sp.]